MYAKSRNIAIWGLALSMMMLSAAIAYFALTIASASRHIPDILATVDNATRQVEKAREEISAVRAMVLPLQQEISEMRQLVPSTLQEVSEARKLVPDVLNEMNTLGQHFALFINEAGEIRQLVPAILEESAHIREQIPLVVEEVQKTREAMPATLDRIEGIVLNVEQVGKTASEGAVSGVVSGVLKAPFRLLGNLGEAIFGASESTSDAVTVQDLDIIRTTTHELLGANTPGDSLNWSNPSSGNHGEIALRRLKSEGERPCRVLSYRVYIRDAKPINQDVDFCLDANQVWRPVLD